MDSKLAETLLEGVTRAWVAGVKVMQDEAIGYCDRVIDLIDSRKIPDESPRMLIEQIREYLITSDTPHIPNMKKE